MEIWNKLTDLADFVLNDTLLTVGKTIIVVITTGLTLYYAVTGTMPIIPQWSWGGMFLFMLIAGITDLEDLAYLGEEEEELDEEEDEEIAED